MRAREVMVHAVDLGGAVTFADLPADFDVALLDDITAKRSAAADGPALLLTPTDDDRTWAVAGAGHPTTGPRAARAARGIPLRPTGHRTARRRRTLPSCPAGSDRGSSEGPS